MYSKTEAENNSLHYQFMIGKTFRQRGRGNIRLVKVLKVFVDEKDPFNEDFEVRVLTQEIPILISGTTPLFTLTDFLKNHEMF